MFTIITFLIFYIPFFYFYQKYIKSSILLKSKMMEIKEFVKNQIGENYSVNESIFEKFDYDEMKAYLKNISEYHGKEKYKTLQEKYSLALKEKNYIKARLKPLQKIHNSLWFSEQVLILLIFLTIIFYSFILFGTFSIFVSTLFLIFYSGFYFITISLFSNRIAQRIREMSLSKTNFRFNYSLFLVSLFVCPILFYNVFLNLEKTNQKIYSIFNSLNFIKHNKIVSSYKKEVNKL